MKRMLLLLAAMMFFFSCSKVETDTNQSLSFLVSEKKAKLTGKVKDVDGNWYKTVTIGTQVWMAENLKTTRLNDKKPIPLVTDANIWSNLVTPGYAIFVDSTSPDQVLFVPVYNWYTVNSGKLCPNGWHVPSDSEWTEMANYLASNGYGYLGSGDDIGKALASTTLWALWDTPGVVGNDLSTNNSSGFNAVPTLYRVDAGYYGGFDYSTANWWSSTEADPDHAWTRDLFTHFEYLFRNSYDKNWGFTVRCIKN